MTRNETGYPIVVAEVYCHDAERDQGATYLRLHNQGTRAFDLAGWGIDWDGVTLKFPQGADLAHGGDAYVAWNAEGFKAQLTRLPDFTVQPAAGLPHLQPSDGTPLAFHPDRGSVRLLTPNSDVADAVVWGNGPAVPGWTGPALTSHGPGTVFRRALDEGTLGPDSAGAFALPGGTANAWRQGKDWMPRRVVKVGQSSFIYPTFTASQIKAWASPDSAFKTISAFIDSARTRLDINLYLLTQEELGRRIETAAQRGVAVRLLLEGEPVGGLSAKVKDLILRLQTAGVEVRTLRKGANGLKRYVFTHAKFAVADQQQCLVSSDNWTATSVPSDGRPGQRGWGVIADCRPLADYLTRVFEFDWNPRSADSQLFDPAVPTSEIFTPDFELLALPELIDAAEITETIQLTPFLAPDHALLERHAITGMIRSAERTVDVQQQSIELFWGAESGGSPEKTPNLFLKELVAAAQRGVQVRVLMSGAHLSADPQDNSRTEAWLRDLAQKEGLPLQARILNFATTKRGIHNKGIIVDGRRVLVSSVNWSQNSPLNNRELGLILESPGVAAYFQKLFDGDWSA